MTISYTTAVGNNRLDQVRTALNANGGGKLIIQNSSNTELVRVNLDASIAAASGKVLTVISAAKVGNATVQGTANKAILVDGADTTVASGLTVGTSGADVILNDLALLVGSQVTINSGTITHP